jgi:hypothetical protein
MGKQLRAGAVAEHVVAALGGSPTQLARAGSYTVCGVPVAPSRVARALSASTRFTQRVYAAVLPPSTFRMLPVLLPDRADEAK